MVPPFPLQLEPLSRIGSNLLRKPLRTLFSGAPGDFLKAEKFARLWATATAVAYRKLIFLVSRMKFENPPRPPFLKAEKFARLWATATAVAYRKLIFLVSRMKFENPPGPPESILLRGFQKKFEPVRPRGSSCKEKKSSVGPCVRASVGQSVLRSVAGRLALPSEIHPAS